jgi:hypothetical protein
MEVLDTEMKVAAALRSWYNDELALLGAVW